MYLNKVYNGVKRFSLGGVFKTIKDGKVSNGFNDLRFLNGIKSFETVKSYKRLIFSSGREISACMRRNISSVYRNTCVKEIENVRKQSGICTQEERNMYVKQHSEDVLRRSKDVLSHTEGVLRHASEKLKTVIQNLISLKAVTNLDSLPSLKPLIASAV